MIIHIFFIIGILISIVGWFLDRANKFKWLMLKIAPDCIFAQRALDSLEADQKIGLTKNHKGFQILLNKWPNLISKQSVEYIGRSLAFIEFGPQVKNDIQLIAYDKEEKEVKERWSMLDARSSIEKILEKKLFKQGVYLFWFGIAVSVISYIISININS
jgi:hypothetical protein